MIGYVSNVDEPLFASVSVDKLASTATIGSWDITFKEIADKIAEATDKLTAIIMYTEEEELKREEPLITFKNDDTIKTAFGKASIDSERVRSLLKRPPQKE